MSHSNPEVSQTPLSIMSAKQIDVVVLGAGVVGLTTAIHIQESLCASLSPSQSCNSVEKDNASQTVKVAIVAEQLPSDPKTIRYVSHWAGAHVVSGAKDEERKKVDQLTFKTIWDLSAPGSDAEHCFLRVPEIDYTHTAPPEPHPLEGWMPEFKHIPQSSLPPGIKSGVSFTTVTIDVPTYLSYLTSRFLKNGGHFVKARVQHISEIIEGGVGIYDSVLKSTDNPSSMAKPGPPAALVVCPGLGARTLGGVADKNMYPIRGQTVIVKAPWVRFARTHEVMASDGEGEVWTYVLPRRSGEVVLGGTSEADDWFPVPRPDTTTAILERALKLVPELVPPSSSASDTSTHLTPKVPTADDLRPLIVYEGCGLRPGRKEGPRVELEWVHTVYPSQKGESAGPGKMPVVYNYGHKGSGYSSSWGFADVVVRLLKEALQL